eukprot:2026614-Pyramimonas_sp.AAC.1
MNDVVGGIVERASIRQLRFDRTHQHSDEAMPDENKPDPDAEGHIGAPHDHPADAGARDGPVLL